jgi:hypothetical protein
MTSPSTTEIDACVTESVFHGMGCGYDNFEFRETIFDAETIEEAVERCLEKCEGTPQRYY